jgi:TonB family protein
VRYTFIYIILLFANNSFSQDTLTRYLDEDFAVTENKNDASFSAEISKLNGLWEATIYYGNGNLACKGSFKEKKLTTRQGFFIFYYASTQRKMHEGHYDENFKTGIWQSWYENGRKKDSGRLDDNRKTGNWTTWYPNGKIAALGSYSNQYEFDIPGFAARTRKEQRNLKWYFLQDKPDVKTGLWNTWYVNGQIKDSLFYTLKGLREGIAKSWYENGNTESAGVYFQDKETGTWEWFYTNGKPATKEKYTSGKLNSMECFDSTGTLTGDFCSLSKPALFPGGTSAFEEYLKKNKKYPPEARNRAGQVAVSFYINTAGKPAGVTVTQSNSDYFSREAERLIYSMPVWEPAISHNRFTEYTVEVMFTFAPPQ